MRFRRQRLLNIWCGQEAEAYQNAVYAMRERFKLEMPREQVPLRGPSRLGEGTPHFDSTLVPVRKTTRTSPACRKRRRWDSLPLHKAQKVLGEALSPGAITSTDATR